MILLQHYDILYIGFSEFPPLHFLFYFRVIREKALLHNEKGLFKMNAENAENLIHRLLCYNNIHLQIFLKKNPEKFLVAGAWDRESTGKPPMWKPHSYSSNGEITRACPFVENALNTIW